MKFLRSSIENWMTFLNLFKRPTLTLEDQLLEFEQNRLHDIAFVELLSSKIFDYLLSQKSIIEFHVDKINPEIMISILKNKSSFSISFKNDTLPSKIYSISFEYSSISRYKTQVEIGRKFFNIRNPLHDQKLIDHVLHKCVVELDISIIRLMKQMEEDYRYPLKNIF